jgi:hypothetical protein
MKKSFAFGIVVATSAALLQPAHAGSRSSAHSFASAPHFSAPAQHFAGPSRSFSSGAARFNAPARFSSAPAFHNRSFAATGPRFSSTAALRYPAYSLNRARFSGNGTTAYNSRTYSAAMARLAAGRTTGVRSQAFNNRERVVARYSANWQRHWDRGRDHFWHGHRCHFRNGFWFLYDPFFFSPYGYGYGYYPYGSYYDGGYYDDSYASDEYAPPAYTDQSQYETGSRVSDVQSALSREGYYDGPIDGRLGSATRKALRRYQRDHGLDVTGGINRAVIEALQLR